jgi:hypothetical protein
MRRIKLTFDLEQETFERIQIDDQKCLSCKRDASQIKIALSYPQSLATCEYDRHITHLLDHIKGIETELKFTSRNQFDFVLLCELFKVSGLY